MCVMATVGESAATWPPEGNGPAARVAAARLSRAVVVAPVQAQRGATFAEAAIDGGVRRAGQPHDLGVAVAEALEVERLSLAGLEGLSRRRSRVRVPSLPYREALQ